MKALRPYQRQSIDTLYDYWEKEKGNGIIVVPTGGGKSLIMAALVKEICDKYKGTRILILAHVKELIQQNHNEIKEYWPEAPIGIFSAGIGRKDIQAQIIVAGIQSIDKHVHKLNPVPEIVIVDEAHLIPKYEGTRYNKVLKTLSQMYPHLRVVGLSATPYRLDTGWLHMGDDSIFHKIVYDVSIQNLINDGYLCNIIAKGGAVKINTDKVKHLGKEFIAKDLEEAAMANDTTEKAVKDMIERGKDRKKWIIFTCGVLHAKQVNDCLDSHGIISKIITGDTPRIERDQIIEDFKNSSSLEEIRALININVLTTGFNAPCIDMIVMLRPTESCGLYVQMIGRGMRISKQKNDCLILDYAENTIRHGPIDCVSPDNKEKGSGDGVAPIKECPECYAFVPISVMVCPYCQFEFPPIPLKIKEKPVDAPLLKSQVVKEEKKILDVQYTEYFIHIKEGKKPSVRIVYDCGLTKVSEWISPEVDNQWGQFFYRKFCNEIGFEYPYPKTAQDFLSCTLPQFDQIVVEKEGQWDKVKKRYLREQILVDIDKNDEIPF